MSSEGISVDADVRVPIRSDLDILYARRQGRKLATALGFTSTEATFIVTAISELARNIVMYAKTGEIALTAVKDRDRRGIIVVAKDRGPGIADIRLAMQSGFSTSGSLGLGLPGAKKLMDEFEVTSKIGQGTTVVAKKWKD
jgi:serine/threonine-protein kinase RsbT